MIKPKVLFICLGNSCRSIMAEALTRHLCGQQWEAASAGLNPLGWVASETKAVLAEIGVDTEGLRSKGLTGINLQDYHLLINLSGHSLKRAIPQEYSDRLRQRPVQDPFGGSLAEYRLSRDAIKELILRELCQGQGPLPGKP
ncbi:MAG: arsenate-mycothiol transferase ArsC [Desulfobaccales bacterium]